MAARGRKASKGGVIIKKNEIIEGGHHGGAWKVAYADFVTAMMAFFLLMWLLNATTEDQRKGLADYFSPSSILSHSSSGTGQPFGGHTAFDQGALVSDRGTVSVTPGRRPVIENTEDGEEPQIIEAHRARNGDGVGIGPMRDDQYADEDPDLPTRGQPGDRVPPGHGGAAIAETPEGKAEGAGAKGRSAARVMAEETRRAEAQAAAEQAAAEKVALETAAQEIRKAVQADPALAEVAKQLSIDMTPGGLRIQIMDEVRLPMFATGSSAPNDRARLLLQKVMPILNKLSEPISIAGHTDAAPFPGKDRSNWELSAERANATRRLLMEGGFPESRIRSVTGNADRDPLLPADPFAAANRRIAILVQRQAPSPAGRP